MPRQRLILSIFALLLTFVSSKSAYGQSADGAGVHFRLIETQTDTGYLSDSYKLKLIEKHVSGRCRKTTTDHNGFVFAVKTNLLYDAVLVPNVGMECHLGKGWAATAGWNCAWWDRDAVHRYWRVYGGEAEVRKYFGGTARKSVLSGHHLGLYGQGFTYDFELGGRGQISELTYGGGIAYGYALPVGRSFNLDFSIGLGYLGGEYKIYDPENGCYVWKETRQRHWMGPTKAEAALVWVIGRKDPQGEKGCRR